MAECEWTRKICREIERCNGRVFAIVGSAMQRPGWPDRIVYHRYWNGLLEFKDVNTKVRPDQRVVIRELRERCPHACYVVRRPCNVEDHDGTLLATFDGTGLGLLKTLQLLRNPE